MPNTPFNISSRGSFGVSSPIYYLGENRGKRKRNDEGMKEGKERGKQDNETEKREETA